MRYLLLILIPSIALGNWMVDTETAKSNQQLPGIRAYASERNCKKANPGKLCVNVAGRNLRYEKFQGGSWVEDAAKKAAHDTEQADIATKQTQKADRRNRLKSAKGTIGSANSVAALRAIVADILEELNDLAKQ